MVEKRVDMINKKLFVGVDADNTLWDTDSVFAEAQLSLLSKLESTTGIEVAEGDKLNYIRQIDQEIARLHGFDLKYPVEILVRAVEVSLLGEDPRTAAKIAVESQFDIATLDIYGSYAKWFLEEISNNVPKLRPGVKEGLRKIADQFGKIVIFTEGRERTCWSNLKYHGVDAFVEDVILCKKGVEFYTSFVERNKHAYLKFIMIGDQLDRDIVYAKAAGFVTIYFPGGFLPYWVDISDKHSFDYEIINFLEVSLLLENVIT